MEVDWSALPWVLSFLHLEGGCNARGALPFCVQETSREQLSRHKSASRWCVGDATHSGLFLP